MLKYLILLVLSFNLFALDENIKGEGKFYATDDDSLTFIQKELTNRAFKVVISKKLEELGLNKDLFWQKYEESFNKSFTYVEDNLKKKYKINEKPAKEDRENFAKELRRVKLIRKRKFGNLNRIISSYSIDRSSRSAKNPKIRFMKLHAKVNENLLTKIYYGFVQGKKTGDYGTLYIHVDYNLKNSSYSELGIGNENELANTVNNAWLSKFSKNKPSNIKNIEILEGDKLKELGEYLKLPYERMIEEIPSNLRNSLLLKVEINIEKINVEEDVKKYTFQLGGGLFLQDLQNLQILFSTNFEKQTKDFILNKRNSELKKLLATVVYKTPTNSFFEVQEKVKNISPMTTIQRLALYDFDNINSVYSLIELLENKGIKYSMKARLESIGKSRAELIVFYDGIKTDLKAILSGIQSAKNGQNYDVIDSDTVLGIKFNKLGEKTL